MKRSVWLVFVVYCLLSSAAWIIAPSLERAFFFERQIILFVVVGVGAIAFSGGRLRTLESRPWVRLAVAGVFFWGVPACLIRWVESGISSVVTSAAFALLPVVVAVCTISGGVSQDRAEGWGSLTPALAAFGGILLLLPVGLPGPVRGQLMLAVAFIAVVLVAISGEWMHRLMQGVAIADAAVIGCFANAAFLVICGLVARDFAGGWIGLTTILSLSSGIDLIQIILVFWLLREMSPVRFATRYLVIPLLTIVEGYVFLRPEVTARMLVGGALLTAGTAWILFAKAPDDKAILSLR